MNTILGVILMILTSCSQFSSSESIQVKEKSILWEVFNQDDSASIIGIIGLSSSLNAFKNRVVEYQVIDVWCKECYSDNNKGFVFVKVMKDSFYYFKYEKPSLFVGQLNPVSSTMKEEKFKIEQEIKSLQEDSTVVQEAQLTYSSFTKDILLKAGGGVNCSLSNPICDRIYYLWNTW